MSRNSLSRPNRFLRQSQRLNEMDSGSSQDASTPSFPSSAEPPVRTIDPSTASVVTEVEYETFISTLLSEPSSKKIPENPSFFYNKEDIFTPEAPGQTHTEVIRMHIKGRKAQEPGWNTRNWQGVPYAINFFCRQIRSFFVWRPNTQNYRFLKALASGDCLPMKFTASLPIPLLELQ